MCVNGLNSLGSPNIFRGHRYGEWMPEVCQESYKFYVKRMKEGSPEHPDPIRLSLEKKTVCSVRRITSTQGTAVKGFV